MKCRKNRKNIFTTTLSKRKVNLDRIVKGKATHMRGEGQKGKKCWKSYL